MQSHKSLTSQMFHNPLFTGTLLLTLSGVVCRIIGFLYRIFLSQWIGAAELGIYQLTFPWTILTLSLCASGVQTAISSCIARQTAASQDASCPHIARQTAASAHTTRQTAASQGAVGFSILRTGLWLALAPALLCAIVFRYWKQPLARYMLGDAAYAPYVQLLSYYILPATIHACINGYYYGRKKTMIPSLMQLLEQLIKVGSVAIFYTVLSSEGKSLTGLHALWGLVLGEWGSMLLTITAILYEHTTHTQASTAIPSSARSCTVWMDLLRISLPLTLNHSVVHLCACLENLLIPRQLEQYGQSRESALAFYGVYSGMALPVIYLPCILTNSLSVLLLPSVASAKARKDHGQIMHYMQSMLWFGFGAGGLCTVLFFLTGPMCGALLFHNDTAGTIIRYLSFLCPLLFLHGVYTGILHGLSRLKDVLFINLLASLIRCLFLWGLVPVYGAAALIWCLIISNIFCVIADLYLLREYLR